MKRWTNASAVSATSRQPLSMISACPFLGSGSGHGIHQLLADPELEQLVGDQHVATLPSSVFADADLLPVDADYAVGPDSAETKPAPSRSVARAELITARVGATGIAEPDPCSWLASGLRNLSTGVASPKAWCGRPAAGRQRCDWLAVWLSAQPRWGATTSCSPHSAQAPLRAMNSGGPRWSCCTWLLHDVLGPVAAKGSVANRRERRYLARPRLWHRVMELGLRGKLALVTAASRGLGRGLLPSRCWPRTVGSVSRRAGAVHRGGGTRDGEGRP